MNLAVSLTRHQQNRSTHFWNVASLIGERIVSWVGFCFVHISLIISEFDHPLIQLRAIFTDIYANYLSISLAYLKMSVLLAFILKLPNLNSVYKIGILTLCVLSCTLLSRLSFIF